MTTMRVVRVMVMVRLAILKERWLLTDRRTDGHMATSDITLA